MEIKQAEFVISNTQLKECPETGLPEFAFIGRSNVGKSSLINMLTKRKSLAKTSATPGKTQLINHFIINDSWYLVDLPGYGYAKVSKSSREKWHKFVSNYLLNRETLQGVCVLIDSRIPPQKIDLEFMEFLGTKGVPFCIVFTKTDKLSSSELSRNLAAYKKEMLKFWVEFPHYFLSSSTTSLGREEILEFLHDAMAEA